MTFNVIDPKTGEYPDLEHIARTEEWAKNLIPCDMEGFCINEDGNLLLMDECGNYAYCPPDRFQVIFGFNECLREEHIAQEYNQDIRQAIKQSRIKQYEIAAKIGCHQSTLCSWLHIGELSPDRKKQILKAIDEIKNGG